MCKRICLFLFLSVGAIAASYAQNNSLGISYDKISTLVFEEEIVDAELGSSEYHVKVKGRYLLLRAKHKNIPPTSLFVRYGKKKQHYYIAEIFPDGSAPLQYLLQEDADNNVAKTDPTTDTIFIENKQEYFDIGITQDGVQVILNKILHTDNTTNLQLFIHNTSSIDLCLAQWTFEYVTRLSKGVFKNKKKHKLVEPIIEPSNIKVLAERSVYVEFAIPTYVSEEGLEIFLGENDGERGFRFLIPSRVLLKAKKKSV